LFTLTSFVGATLLFLVQPMAVKRLLPLFGGTPTVWNTASLFFQLLLLGGYLGTHLLATRLPVRQHAHWHVLLVLAPLATLPVGVAASSPDSSWPALALVLLLASAVGAPFLALSTAGPLLQRWFGASRHARAHDPYFLFAAGNTGSFLGLISYPLLIEPHLHLRPQERLWSLGYALWVLLLAACALTVRHSDAPPLREPAPALRPTARRQARWVLLAALASSLSLGTTTHLTTDVAPVPLLWVVPLGLYLLSFVAAFALSAETARRSSALLGRALPFVLLPAVIVPVTGVGIVLDAGLSLLLLLVVATCAHLRLSADRPGTGGLTRFYLVVAAGGALGGLVNGLAAPLLLDRLYEYPVAVALSLLLVPRRSDWSWLRRRYGLLGAVPGALLLAFETPFLRAVALDHAPGVLALLALCVLAALLARSGPRALAVGAAAALLVPLAASHPLAAKRSFFGTQEVVASGRLHLLRHGTTLHGWQDGARPERAQAYYEASGPVGQVLRLRAARLRHGRLGVVGLGSGALAAYGQPGEQIRFFEIDPDTVSLARDPRLFTYLRDSRAAVDVVLGDGRLSLEDEPRASFDVLVLDAFSSDAVPLHLLTRQAVTLYLARLRPGGVVLFHVSNRYLDLVPPLARVARADGAVGLYQRHAGDVAAGGIASVWVALAHDAVDLADLDADPRWSLLEAVTGHGDAWSDDYSDVLSALLR
jgi:SAM-dependent methyltransferase